MASRKRPVGLAVLVVVVLGVAALGVNYLRCGNLSGCDANGLPLGPVSYQFVSSRSSAHLDYPKARKLTTRGTSESRDPLEGVTNSASAGAVLVTADTPTQVYAWYRERLLAEKWTPYPVAPFSTQLTAQGYKHGTREFFVVAIDDPKQLSDVRGITAGGTVLEYTYTIAARH